MFSRMSLKNGLVNEDVPTTYKDYLSSSGKMVMNGNSDNVKESIVARIN